MTVVIRGLPNMAGATRILLAALLAKGCWLATVPALAGETGDAHAVYQQALERLRTQQHDEAVTLFSEAIEIDPHFIEAYEGRAKAYEALDQIENSMNDRERAAELRVVADVSRQAGSALVQSPDFWLIVFAFVGSGMIGIWLCVRRFNMLIGSRAPELGEQNSWGHK